MKGTVVFFNNTYGFIRGEDSRDYYVHFTKIRKEDDTEYRSLYTGQNVKFGVLAGNEAIDVTPVTELDGVITCNIVAYKMNDGEYLHGHNVYSEIFKKLNNGIKFVVYKDGFLVGTDVIIPRDKLSNILSKLDKNDFKLRKGDKIEVEEGLAINII